MSRIVMPQHFSLQTQSFNGFIKNGQADKALEAFLKLLKLDENIKPGVNIPVKLRWVHSPVIGIPRQPFTVYRTTHLYNQLSSKKVALITNSVSISGDRKIEWGLKEMYYLVFNVSVSTGDQLIINALDSRGNTIPFQRFVLTRSMTARFRSPGIASLRIEGRGVLNSTHGISQDVVANEAQWQRIASVGLPYKTDEVTDNVYSNAKQGVWVSDVSGLEAAQIRLKVEHLLQNSVPTIPDPDIPTPILASPNVSDYLNMLRDHDLSPVSMITDCLNNTDNAELSRLQADFIRTVSVPGLQQAESIPTTPPDPATAGIPVVGTTMLTVGSDSFAATGLGYGMVDFIPAIAKSRDDPADVPGLPEPAFQYMTVGRFKIPFIEGIDLPPGEVELAALDSIAPPPDAAANLSTERFQRLRPAGVDQPEQESIKLLWDLCEIHQGYIVGVSRQAGSLTILNEKLNNNMGVKRIIPPRPARYEGDPPLDQSTSYVDPLSPVPFSGTASQKYVLIGQDVFSRWSNWVQAQYISQAPVVQIPTLQNISLEIDPTPLPSSTPGLSSVFSGALEVIIGWDWTDRTPHHIELYGRFVNFDFTPPGGFSSKFQRVQTSGSLPETLVISFNGTAGTPSVSGNFTTSIEEIIDANASESGDSDERRYRLTVHNLECSFALGNEIAYAVRARATENILPVLRSDFTGTQVTNGFNPAPPLPPSIPAELNWTALPDATNAARGVLEWEPIANTRGYVIWEATETALRQLIEPNRPAPDLLTSLQDRATELRDMLATVDDDVDFHMRAFSRLNTDLIRSPKFELSLPGNADTIYVYQISAVGQNNLESERDNSAAFYAVPKHIKPSQPSLLLRELPRVGGIKILILPGTGRAPFGYRVHRVRQSSLLMDIGTMGPPIFDETATQWTQESVPTRLSGVGLSAQIIIDPVPESWYPYYYRVVALGEEDLDAGKLQGESEASISQVGFNPPAQPPALFGPETGSNTWLVEREHSVGRSPRGLAFHPRLNILCVTNFNSNTVSLISTVTNRVIKTIAVKSRPWGITVDPNSHFAYATNYQSGSVSIIDLQRRKHLKSITGLSRPSGIVHSAQTNRLFVTDVSKREVFVINLSTSRIEKRIRVGGRPYNLDIHSNGRSEILLIADYSSGRIIQINTSTLLVEHSQFIGGRPFNIAVHSRAHLAFICDNTNDFVVVLDIKTLIIQSTWTTNKRPISCCVDEVSNQLFVVSYSGSVDVFDIISGQLLQKIKLQTPLYDVIFNPTSQTIYAAKINKGQVISFKREASTSETHFVFTFQTDLPKRVTSLGNAWITLAEDYVDVASAQIARDIIKHVETIDVTEDDAFEIIPSPTEEDLASMPDIRRVAHSEGISQYSVRVRLASKENGKIVLILTDPLNRVTESIIEEHT